MRRPTSLLLLFLIGCGGAETATQDQDSARSRVEPEPPHRGSVHKPPLSVSWIRARTQIETRNSLSIAVVLNVGTSTSAHLEIAAFGLEGRSRRLDLGTHQVSSRRKTIIDVDVADLPLQSTTHSVQLMAVATIEHDGRPLSIQSEALGHHYESGYRRALVYSIDDMVEVFHGGIVDPNRAAEARIIEPSRTRLLTNVRPTAQFVGADGSRTFKPSQQDWPTTNIGCLLAPWSCCTGPNCVTVCADWTTTYVDASHYEDFAKDANGFQSVDASFAHFEIEQMPNCPPSGFCSFYGTKVAEGFFGPSGCAKVNLAAGEPHRLSVFTEHQKDGVSSTVDYYTANNYDSKFGVMQFKKSFAVVAAQQQSTYALDLYPHPVANAAAALSRALNVATPKQGLLVRAGVGCHGGVTQGGIPGTDACAPGTSLNTGPFQNPDGSAGDLRWKFILGHEIGHTYQAAANAQPGAQYCWTPNNNATSNCDDYAADPPGLDAELCRCDHVTGSNKLHCMQSMETQGSAQSEGFAQFFAARTWNDENGNDCDFNYYKQFNAFLFFGTAVVQPPVHLDCRTEVRWRDTFCFHSQVSTEYDWLNFLWNVNTVGNNASSMDDLFAIWKIALQSSSNPSWAIMKSAAGAHFGTSSPKYSRFVAAADDFGVDDDK